ncbi:MAG: hypothetical protein ACRCXZ_03090 [Patescibacteria group bacterium]
MLLSIVNLFAINSQTMNKRFLNNPNFVTFVLCSIALLALNGQQMFEQNRINNNSTTPLSTTESSVNSACQKNNIKVAWNTQSETSFSIPANTLLITRISTDDSYYLSVAGNEKFYLSEGETAKTCSIVDLVSAKKSSVTFSNNPNYSLKPGLKVGFELSVSKPKENVAYVIFEPNKAPYIAKVGKSNVQYVFLDNSLPKGTTIGEFNL